jgi:hypothetical protein
MQNFFIKATAIFLLLLLFLCIFLEYRQYSSYKVPIHANATIIIKLNTDAFIKTFIAEYGVNVKGSLQADTAKGKDTPLSTGLQIPGNFFVYGLPLQNEDAFFCTLKISSQEAFINYCAQQFNLPLIPAGAFMKGNKDKITVLCNREYAAIALAANTREATAILEDILNKKNLLPSKHILLKKLKKHREHITVVGDSTIATAVFSSKELQFHAVTSPVKKIIIPAQSKQRIFDKDACASFYCNGIPVSSLLKPAYTVKQFSIVTDSIVSHMKGYTDVELLGSVTQQDTVTTYEYDDNFEKKEKQSVTKVSIPLLRMVCNTSSQQMIHYLQQQGFVTAGKKLNKEVFPLYDVSVINNDHQLQLQTGEDQSLKEQFVSSSTFTGGVIDFIKLRKQHNFSLINRYTNNINRFAFNGTQRKDQQVELNGSIVFQQAALRSVIELVKGL